MMGVPLQVDTSVLTGKTGEAANSVGVAYQSAINIFLFTVAMLCVYNILKVLFGELGADEKKQKIMGWGIGLAIVTIGFLMVMGIFGQ